jgi:hypothetical protein
MFISIAILIIVVIIIYKYNATEGFATKQDKANAIYNWFSGKKTPKYSDYKKALQSKSNIVEYEDVLNLHKQGKLSVDNIAGVI